MFMIYILFNNFIERWKTLEKALEGVKLNDRSSSEGFLFENRIFYTEKVFAFHVM